MFHMLATPAFEGSVMQGRAHLRVLEKQIILTVASEQVPHGCDWPVRQLKECERRRASSRAPGWLKNSNIGFKGLSQKACNRQ